MFLFCGIQKAQAQIVNIEKERIRNQDSIALAGKLSTTFNLTQNKNLLINSDINPHLQYKNRKHILLGIAQWEYAALNKKNINNGGYVHLRYNYALFKNSKLEIFTQLQYNKVWNMPYRYLLGAGPRFKLLDAQKQKIYTGPLYMYEIQSVKADNYIQHNHRISTYVSWNTQLTSSLSFNGTVYYQPKIDQFSNYRLTGLCELNVVISKKLTFDNRFSYIYDQTLTTDVPASSYRYTAGLGYKF
jgi:hypothetical protein